MANPNSKLLLLRAMLIIGAGFWVFIPAIHGDWLMDDDFYLTQNALLHDPARLWKIWFAPGSLIEYYPIEASLQTVQWHFWQNETTGYHLTNILLHLTGAFLVWHLLAKFHLRLAWLGGLLFAIHPIMVESVAWISEFKNVLSLPPFILAMCFWMDYEETKRGRDYGLALGLFLVAMLCKVSMVLFPVIILLYAWWKRDRIGWNDLKVSSPFFLISIVLAVVSIATGTGFRVSHHQTELLDPIGGVFSRLALGGTSLAFYFFQFIWPINLLPLYPKWTVNPPSFTQFFPWLILVIAMAGCWIKRKSWGRHVILGLGFFLINILPFIGFRSVSYMTYSWVMDHFLYLPVLGLIGLAIAGLEQLENRLEELGRIFYAGVLALAMALLAWQSHWYAGLCVGQEALWTYTVEHNPGAVLAHNNLGNILLATDRAPQAIQQYELALQINPDMPEANNNLGFALSQRGRYPEAITHFERALTIYPHYVVAHTNLAHALAQTGRTAEAIQHYKEAIQFDPQNAEARNSLRKLQNQP